MPGKGEEIGYSETNRLFGLPMEIKNEPISNDLMEKLETIEEKVDNLNRKIDHIFGNSILLDNEFINLNITDGPGGFEQIRKLVKRKLNRGR